MSLSKHRTGVSGTSARIKRLAFKQPNDLKTSQSGMVCGKKSDMEPRDNNRIEGKSGPPVLDRKVGIGSVSLENPFILAPLAGISNLPFRLLAKSFGCALVCSEMVSAQGLVRNSKKSLDLMQSTEAEKPLSVQIFGADPNVMAEAARIVEARGADILDMNFGCAVKKVIKTGSGAALMRCPELAEAVLRSVRKSIQIPLTVKIRSGWNPDGGQAFQIAALAEDCGVDAVTVHPRTGLQGFKGKADWSLIRAVKERLSIPVIGNGDVFSAQDALRMLQETGCDAVMIGRGAVGSPWIFSQAFKLLEGSPVFPVSMQVRKTAMQYYVRTLTASFGETRAAYMLRSRLGWFVKGMPYAGRFREALKTLSSEAEALESIRTLEASCGAHAEGDLSAEEGSHS